ncbi:MAG: stage IV sporulation protein A [Ruminococcaceae bacterium]|nr:stage IV sporulation protein A [Oscillospiraceae bacterium]
MANIYKDIAQRTGGDIYIGVVGPVRCGKSTLIKNFMEKLVIPNISDENAKIRATDELPQSASGKTVMTTEPKFVPEQAASVNLGESVYFRTKLIDCVGFIVEGAEGLTEEGNQRMVMTPWSKSPLPFEQAAELGTQKVIREHSTIGILVTTDASFGDLKRENYEKAEAKAFKELEASGKPYVIVLNSAEPQSERAQKLKAELEEKYNRTVCLTNCYTLDEKEIEAILSSILMEFPLTEISFKTPKWLLGLDEGDESRRRLLDSLQVKALNIRKMKEVSSLYCPTEEQSYTVEVEKIDCSNGKVECKLIPEEKLFFKVLSQKSKMEISDESELIKTVTSLLSTKERFDKIKNALDQAQATGYGIVVPSTEDIKLEDPEVIKQPGGHGIRFKASAPSIHMIKANVKTQISPIIGSEKQSEDMASFILDKIDREPEKVWELNMFGKTLNDLMNEELSSKLEKIPNDARLKFVDMLQKIINEGSGGLICIIL